MAFAAAKRCPTPSDWLHPFHPLRFDRDGEAVRRRTQGTMAPHDTAPLHWRAAHEGASLRHAPRGEIKVRLGVLAHADVGLPGRTLVWQSGRADHVALSRASRWLQPLAARGWRGPLLFSISCLATVLLIVGGGWGTGWASRDRWGRAVPASSPAAVSAAALADSPAARGHSGAASAIEAPSSAPTTHRPGADPVLPGHDGAAPQREPNGGELIRQAPLPQSLLDAAGRSGDAAAAFAGTSAMPLQVTGLVPGALPPPVSTTTQTVTPKDRIIAAGNAAATAGHRRASIPMAPRGAGGAFALGPSFADAAVMPAPRSTSTGGVDIPAGSGAAIPRPAWAAPHAMPHGTGPVRTASLLGAASVAHATDAAPTLEVTPSLSPSHLAPSAAATKRLRVPEPAIASIMDGSRREDTALAVAGSPGSRVVVRQRETGRAAGGQAAAQPQPPPAEMQPDPSVATATGDMNAEGPAFSSERSRSRDARPRDDSDETPGKTGSPPAATRTGSADRAAPHPYDEARTDQAQRDVLVAIQDARTIIVPGRRGLPAAVQVGDRLPSGARLLSVDPSAGEARTDHGLIRLE